MAVLKCKMCGGSLEVLEGDSIAKCEYCGTLQTIPIEKGDKILNLYERASHYRRNNDYDKALEIYENILNENTKDAEAYWSIILCKYGIEYVEDPETHKRVPTVNRTQTTSIFADEDYKSAIEYADEQQRAIYEREAAEIDEIQKGILAISSHEEPFDVFICYKETDDSGRRTRDSVLAQELFYGLREAGFKVFFSRITLEDKLGSEYEPYIFAALNSAKVMVAVGTKKEYYESPWVRNEWLRFLALTKDHNDKVLIPAYRDMDPYDLPTEFSHLQGQDMAKLGFMQDIIRGIKKIIGSKKKQEKVIVQNNNIQTGITAESLLTRTRLFLEDGEYEKANEYVERILDINPMCAEGYLCNMLVDYRVPNIEGLLKCVNPLDDNKDFEKIMRFGSDELKAKMNDINERIRTQAQLRITNNAKQGIYDRAASLSQFDDPLKLEKAASEFRSLGKWKDAEVRADECQQRKSYIEKEMTDAAFERAEHLKQSNNPKEIEEAIGILKKLGTYRNANAIIEDCKQLVESKKQAIYNKANQLGASETEEDIKKAKSYYDFLGGYRDAKLKADECRTKLQNIKDTRTQAANVTIKNEHKNNKKLAVGIVVVMICIIIAIMCVVLIASMNNSRPITNPAMGVEFAYEKEGDGLKITRCIFSSDTITIPFTIDDVPVKKIGDSAFMGMTAVKRVNIPSNVITIGARAFEGCTSLESISINASEIGEGAFRGCTNLSKVEMSNQLQVIEKEVFYGCTNLRDIEIPDSVTRMGYNVFTNCTNLNSVKLSNKMHTIERNTFYNCTNLRDVEINTNVTRIKERAFYNCTNLTKLIIPSDVAYIEEYAIDNCPRLKVYAESYSKPKNWAAKGVNARVYYFSSTPKGHNTHWHYSNGVPEIWQ